MAINLAGVSEGGWIVGGLCWLVLRLIGRVEALEAEHAKTAKLVQEIHETVVSPEMGHLLAVCRVRGNGSDLGGK